MNPATISNSQAKGNENRFDRAGVRKIVRDLKAIPKEMVLSSKITEMQNNLPSSNLRGHDAIELYIWSLQSLTIL